MQSKFIEWRRHSDKYNNNNTNGYDDASVNLNGFTEPHVIVW